MLFLFVCWRFVFLFRYFSDSAFQLSADAQEFQHCINKYIDMKQGPESLCNTLKFLRCFYIQPVRELVNREIIVET